MTNRIKSYAIEQSTSSLFMDFKRQVQSFFGNSRPYAFGRSFSDVFPDPYDVKGLDTYSNKFIDLPVSSYKEIVDQLRASPEKFKEFSASYIAGNDSIPSVRMKIEKFVGDSYILDSRKDVIKVMLKHFEEKDFISFVSMAPLQIEGIFADICRDVGVSESQLDISSLNEKLQHLEEKMNNFFYFEYYSFIFPVLRNLVAHGGLIKQDIEHTAMELLLDLLPVCELTVSKELPINHALDVLRKAAEGDNQSLVEWLELQDKVKIPDFYKVGEKVSHIEEARYTSQEFWDFIDSQLKGLTDLSQLKHCMPVKVAGILKKKGIAASQAANFLKSLSRAVPRAIGTRC